MSRKFINKIENIVNTLKQEFTNLYQERLETLILFGSQARGDARKDSDIDILVVLKDDVNPVLEIKNNSALISDLCLEYDKDINCFYIDSNQFKENENLLLTNIKNEGVFL